MGCFLPSKEVQDDEAVLWQPPIVPSVLCLAPALGPCFVGREVRFRLSDVQCSLLSVVTGEITMLRLSFTIRNEQVRGVWLIRGSGLWSPPYRGGGGGVWIGTGHKVRKGVLSAPRQPNSL